ncbi:hypothetical protein NN561_020088 [Cricetulus griseus]
MNGNARLEVVLSRVQEKRVTSAAGRSRHRTLWERSTHLRSRVLMSNRNLEAGKRLFQRLSQDKHLELSPQPSLWKTTHPGFSKASRVAERTKAKARGASDSFLMEIKPAGGRGSRSGLSSDVSPQPLPALPALPSSCGLHTAQPGEAAGSSPSPGHRPAKGSLRSGAAGQMLGYRLNREINWGRG